MKHKKEYYIKVLQDIIHQVHTMRIEATYNYHTGKEKVLYRLEEAINQAIIDIKEGETNE